MAANQPTTQILMDDGAKTVVKVTGYYNTAASNANTQIINAKTLAFANSSQNCILTLIGVQYSVDLSTGFVQLAWEGVSSNTEILTFGTSTTGTFSGWFPNNATNPTGNVTISVYGAQPNDCYNFILILNKEPHLGYANAYLGYNNFG